MAGTSIVPRQGSKHRSRIAVFLVCYVHVLFGDQVVCECGRLSRMSSRITCSRVSAHSWRVNVDSRPFSIKILNPRLCRTVVSRGTGTISDKDDTTNENDEAAGCAGGGIGFGK